MTKENDTKQRQKICKETFEGQNNGKFIKTNLIKEIKKTSQEST